MVKCGMFGGWSSGLTTWIHNGTAEHSEHLATASTTMGKGDRIINEKKCRQ